MATPAYPLPLEKLLKRAAELEHELLEVERMLGVAGVGTVRPGAHLVVEAGGHHALIEAAGVVQIARIVEFTPIAGAAGAVLGGFVWRGRPGIALDLALILGSSREPELDAHFIVVGGARLLGILVDRVRHVVEAPVRVDAATEQVLPGFRSEIIAGWCDVGGWILPLVSRSAMQKLALGDAQERNPRPSAGEGERT